ncbi:hypothetical protein V2G26_006222 [Clonostachys chloroleuca]
MLNVRFRLARCRRAEATTHMGGWWWKQVKWDLSLGRWWQTEVTCSLATFPSPNSGGTAWSKFTLRRHQALEICLVLHHSTLLLTPLQGRTSMSRLQSVQFCRACYPIRQGWGFQFFCYIITGPHLGIYSRRQPSISSLLGPVQAAGERQASEHQSINERQELCVPVMYPSLRIHFAVGHDSEELDGIVCLELRGDIFHRLC